MRCTLAPAGNASTEQVWSLGTASPVQSARRGSLCCSTRTVSVSSGWSWSLSASTVGWRTTCPTPTRPTWSGLRRCCATCSLGPPDASSFKRNYPYTRITSTEDIIILISHDPKSQCSALQLFEVGFLLSNCTSLCHPDLTQLYFPHTCTQKSLPRHCLSPQPGMTLI